jgi:endonuclease-3
MARESQAARKTRAAQIIDRLGLEFPDARVSLTWDNPLELLVAVILSAQCTDERVNLVTPALFRRFPDAAAYARADLGELEEAVRSTGFFRNKARNIRDCCRELEHRFGGRVPRTMAELVSLPGVGRKTANVVLGNAFGIPGVVVDTHVGRLSRRLGLTVNEDPVKVERDLMKIVPESEWTRFSLLLIGHGRRHCKALRPGCRACPVAGLCPSRRLFERDAG